MKVSAMSGVLRFHTGDGGIVGSELDGQCDAVSATDPSSCRAIRCAQGQERGWETSRSARRAIEDGYGVERAVGDGEIEVALPGDLHANVDASTGDGHITTDIRSQVSGA